MTYRFEILRRGVHFGWLRVADNSQPEIRFTADAEVKMTLSGTFALQEDLDVLTDTVRVLQSDRTDERAAGVFCLSDPEIRRDGDTAEMALEGYDKTRRAQQCVLETRLSLPAGMLYTTAVEQLLVRSGIIDSAIDTSDAVLLTAREWEPGETALSIINTLLAEMCYNSLWADADGVVRAAAYAEPKAGAVAHVYRDDGHSTVLPELTETGSMEGTPNVFVVLVDSSDLTQSMRAVAENSDPASPVSTVNRRARIASVKKLDNIPSAEALQTYANNLALKSQLAVRTVSFSTAAEALHGLSDVLYLARGNKAGIFVETEWSLQLVPAGVYAHTARRVLYL